MTTIAGRTSLVGGLAVTLSVAIASCGGNVRDSLGDSDPESGGSTTVGNSSGGGSKATGAGGKTAGAGAVGAGAVPGTAGKSGGAGAVAGGGKGGGPVGGKAGAAGVPAAGGAPVVDPCSGVLCQPLDCPAGTAPVFAPGVCCASCIPICFRSECPLLKCGPNEIATTLPGQCCPRCEYLQPPDAGAPCGASGYTLLRNELEQKYGSTTCTSDSECVAGAVNVCGRPDCGIALPAGMYMSFVSNLQSYALANCTGCAPIVIECPATTPKAKCLRNYCTLVRE